MICLQVFTADSAFPLALLLYGLLVTCVMSHDSHNLAKAWQEYCGPLSETMYLGYHMSWTVGLKLADDRLGSRVCKVIDFPKVTVVVDSHKIVHVVVGEKIDLCHSLPRVGRECCGSSDFPVGYLPCMFGIHHSLI